MQLYTIFDCPVCTETSDLIQELHKQNLGMSNLQFLMYSKSKTEVLLIGYNNNIKQTFPEK